MANPKKKETKKVGLKDLTEYVSKKGDLNKTEARDLIKTTFEGIQHHLKRNDRVTITGVGSFTKKVKPARKGGKKATNPFTGEEYVTKDKPAETKVQFRPAKNFRQEIQKKR